jgi:recombination protein RecA
LTKKKIAENKDFSNFMESMEETFGDSFEDMFVEETSETEEIPKEIISTGAISLDISIGIGGIPKSKICTIFGAYASGKTTLALSIAKKFIEHKDKVLYIDVENMTDFEYIQQVSGKGITSKDIVLVQPDTGEDAFKTAEMGINSKEFGLIIFDSVGAIAPKKEKEDEFEDVNVAVTARLLTKFLRRNAYNIRVNNIAFIFINQVRDSIGSYMGGYEMPGGEALKHYASLIIFMGKGQTIKQGKEDIGIMTKFVIKKNKLAAPYRTANLPIIFGKGVDYYRDLLDFGKLL